MATPALAIAEALGLESLDQSSAPTFQEMLERLYQQRFQGRIILDFAGGLPRSIVVESPPLRVSLGNGTKKTA